MDEKLNLDDINALIEALDSWEREDIQKIIKAGVSRAGISKDKESEKKELKQRESGQNYSYSENRS